MSTTLCDLEEDSLAKCCSFLCYRDVVNLSAICRRMRTTATSNPVWAVHAGRLLPWSLYVRAREEGLSEEEERLTRRGAALRGSSARGGLSRRVDTRLHCHGNEDDEGLCACSSVRDTREVGSGTALVASNGSHSSNNPPAYTLESLFLACAYHHAASRMLLFADPAMLTWQMSPQAPSKLMVVPLPPTPAAKANENRRTGDTLETLNTLEAESSSRLSWPGDTVPSFLGGPPTAIGLNSGRYSATVMPGSQLEGGDVDRQAGVGEGEIGREGEGGGPVFARCEGSRNAGKGARRASEEEGRQRASHLQHHLVIAAQVRGGGGIEGG